MSAQKNVKNNKNNLQEAWIWGKFMDFKQVNKIGQTLIICNNYWPVVIT